MSAAFPSRRVLATSAAVVALLLAVLLSLAVGARAIAPSTVLDALLHGGTGDDAEVVRQLRVPRTLIGLMVGVALALAGTALQGITRNPIADPGILGISQGSSVAVVLAIAFFGVHDLSGYVWFAFAGAALASVAVYAIASGGRGGATPVKLALGGAAINALLLSVTTGVLTTRASALDEFRFWQIGSLDGRDAEIVGQFENQGGTPEQFGLVLDKGSALTSCVTDAVDTLRENGTLAKIEQQWLSDAVDAPVLK